MTMTHSLTHSLTPVPMEAWSQWVNAFSFFPFSIPGNKYLFEIRFIEQMWIDLLLCAKRCPMAWNMIVSQIMPFYSCILMEWGLKKFLIMNCGTSYSMTVLCIRNKSLGLAHKQGERIALGMCTSSWWSLEAILNKFLSKDLRMSLRGPKYPSPTMTCLINKIYKPTSPFMWWFSVSHSFNVYLLISTKKQATKNLRCYPFEG